MEGGKRAARRLLLGLGAIAACAGLGGAAASGAGASDGGAAIGSALVRVGPAIAHPAPSLIHGRLPAATPVHVTVTLRPRDPAALAAYARAVSTPGSPDYRRYLTPAAFGARFGAAPTQIALVRQALAARGLRPGPTSPGRLSIPVSASAAIVQRAFAVSLQTLSLPRHRLAVTADARPAVPAAAAGIVQSVLGLDSTVTMRPLLARRVGPRAHAVTSPRAPRLSSHATTAPHACGEAQAAATQQKAYTSDQIAAAYGFAPAYAAGDGGAGVTVAVYELEPNDPADIAHYQSCYGTHAAISYVRVDGGAGTGPGTGEAALDIENLIGFAPDVNVIVYQGPNSVSDAPGSGPYDTFSAIVNQDRARVVTVSWGQCEQAVTQSSAIAENTLFEQAAVQGQTIVAADGDSGAQDCNSGATSPQVQTAVDDPGSQPYVTGVGGTTLSALGPRPSETVWNSGGSPLGSLAQDGASGGGVSSFWPMPPDQLSAASALGVRGAASGVNPCGASSGVCRGVPDISADADPATGYLVYWNGSGSAVGQPGWQSIGGTSAAAPVWAALMALADGSVGCATSPLGFANPALYRAAGTAYSADFNDITSGNNDFTHTNGGRYQAGTGYDLTTGLGTPNAAALIASLCADSVHFAGPAAQRSTVGARVALRLRAQDVAGSSVRFSGAAPSGATGLPPGLRLSPSGVISGRPTRAGRYNVRIAARDGAQATAAVTFGWVVGRAPRISRIVLGATRRDRATLSLTITTSRGAPALQALALDLPPALALTGAGRGVTIRTAGRPSTGVPAITRRSGSRSLQIVLRQPADALQITLGAGILRLRSAAVPPRRSRALTITVNVTDASAEQLRVRSRVRAQS